ncbi:hypothetical protein [Kitasatospora sp. NPDC097643]|uniref:hypothetical protein n=1 Tax=Kitasatospora sp. NPDC097643 TaxID=3157230 RepID=UPI003332F4D7
MAGKIPYESIEAADINSVACCAALGAVRRGGPRRYYGLHFLAVPPVISLVVRGAVFRLVRRTLLSRLRRKHGGAPFEWPGLVAEWHRRERSS